MRRIALAFIALLSIAIPARVSAQTPPVFEDAAPKTKASKISAAIIVIPKLNVRAPIYTGITMDIFDKGVGQWPGTPVAGKKGNIVLGGHRTSGSKPFADIDKLRKGDIVELVSKGKKFRYAVTSNFIVKPTAIWITKPTTNATITLFSCHPKGKTSSRYVIRASLIQ